MATRDYAKIKALSQQIIECIGEDDEGENPDLPKQKQDLDDGGQEPLDDFSPAAEKAPEGSDDEKKKKSKDSALAMMGSVLASKFNQ